MQNQLADLPWWLTLGPAIVTGLFTALGSWLLYLYQLKMKKAEIKGQAELRARELLLELYQKRVERIGESIKEFAGALMGMAGHLQGISEEDGKRQAEAAILVLLRMIREPFIDSINDLEGELKAVGLAEKRQNDLTFIRTALSADLDKVAPNTIGAIYLDFMKAMGLLNSLKNELLNKKSEDLFSIYLHSDQRIAKLK